MLYNVFFCVTYCTYMQKDCMYVRMYFMHCMYVFVCDVPWHCVCTSLKCRYVRMYCCATVTKLTYCHLSVLLLTLYFTVTLCHCQFMFSFQGTLGPAGPPGPPGAIGRPVSAL